MCALGTNQMGIEWNQNQVESKEFSNRPSWFLQILTKRLNIQKPDISA